MIYFKVDGECVPKQRPRVYRGHAFTPKKTKEYEEKVLLAFKSAYKEEIPAYQDMPVVAYITVHQQIPKSFSKKKVQMALDEELVPINHRGDLDNFAKSILDSLNEYCYKDDSAVQILNIRKVYSLKPYTEVTLMSRDEYLSTKGESEWGNIKQ